MPREITFPYGYLWVINPKGEKVSSEISLSPGQLTIYEPITLSENGTYKVFIEPEKVTTGSLKLSAYKVVNVTGSLTPTSEGVSVKPSLSTPGQNAVYTVHGSSGEPVTLTTSGDTLTERFYALEWINEAGSQLVYSGWENPENAFVEKFTLPSSGTDSVVVNPQNAGTGAITLNAYNASDVTGSITPTTEGESKTVSIAAPGQKARITFAATEGKTVTIKTSESSISSGWVWLLNPGGEKLGSEEPIGSGRFEITPATTGTYTVYFSPSGRDTGSVKLTAYLGSHPGAMILRKPSTSAQAETSGATLNDMPASGLSTLSAAVNVSAVRTPATRSTANFIHLASTTTGAHLGGPYTRQAVQERSKGSGSRVEGAVNARVIPIPPYHPMDAGTWKPPVGGHQDSWETGWSPSPWGQEPSLRAAGSTTALAGQALQIDGVPLAGVRLSIEGTSAQTTTDAAGRFLLTGVSAGHHVLVVEGERVHSRTRYGTYEMGVNLVAGKTTILEQTVWLTPLDPDW